MRHSARNIPDLPHLHRDLLKAAVHPGLVLFLHNFPPPISSGRMLESQTYVWAYTVPHMENIVAFKLSIRHSHHFIGKLGGRVGLYMKSHG